MTPRWSTGVSPGTPLPNFDSKWTNSEAWLEKGMEITGLDSSEMPLGKQPRPAEVQAEGKENLECVMGCGECWISIVTPAVGGAMFPSIDLPLSLPEKVVTRILEVLFPGRVTLVCEASSWCHAKEILLWCYGEPPRSCLWDQEAYLQVSRSVGC